MIDETEELLCDNCGDSHLQSAWVEKIDRRQWWCPECSTPPRDRYAGVTHRRVRVHDGDPFDDERPHRPHAGREGFDDETDNDRKSE